MGWFEGWSSRSMPVGNAPQRLRVQCPRSTQRCPNMQGNGETSRSPLAWQQFVGLEAWDLTITWSKMMYCGFQDCQSICCCICQRKLTGLQRKDCFERKAVFQASFLRGYSSGFWGVPLIETGMAKRRSIHLSVLFPVSLTWNLSQISQNKSPFTYHRVCNKYPLHHALYPTY